jgi:hypothetical protein
MQIDLGEKEKKLITDLKHIRLTHQSWGALRISHHFHHLIWQLLTIFDMHPCGLHVYYPKKTDGHYGFVQAVADNVGIIVR